MYAVKPISERSLQRDICEAVGCDYIENSLAFFAAELSEDREHVTDIIGICQFTAGESAEIVTLFPAAGRENDEAMIVMQRTVMSFLYRAGTKNLTLLNTAGPEKLLAACGLKKCDAGYCVELEDFYKSPCHYNNSEK